MRATVCSNAHYSSVDCVKVIRDGELVVSGSRDRSVIIIFIIIVMFAFVCRGINIWNVESVRKGQSRPCYKLRDAHKGWVWSFSADDSTSSLVSGCLFSCLLPLLYPFTLLVLLYTPFKPTKTVSKY